MKKYSRWLAAVALCLGGIPGTTWAEEPEPLVLDIPPADISLVEHEALQPAPVEGYANPQPNWVMAAPDEGPLYQLRGQAGLSYFDTSAPFNDSKLGATYGLDGFINLTEEIGAYGAARANHVSGASQFLGTLGLFKTSDGNGEGFDRIGVGAFVDQFETSNYGDLSLTQFRTQIGYALGENMAAGVRYTNQIHEDVATVGAAQVAVGVTQTIAAFVAYSNEGTFLHFMVGDNLDNDSAFLNTFVRRSLAEDLYAFSDIYYQDNGGWSGVVGIEFRFGPGSSYHRNGRHSAWDDPTIGHSFITGESRFFQNSTNGDLPQLDHCHHHCCP